MVTRIRVIEINKNIKNPPIVRLSVLDQPLCSPPSGAMDPLQQSNSLHLTPELWAKVFAYLEDRQGPIRPVTVQWRQQAEVHQPKLVCKQFREIYSSHPGLVQALYLNCDITVGSLPSLLAWLQQNKSSVQTFRAEWGSPLLEAVLETLVSLQPTLKSVGLGGINACSLSSLAVFTRLEVCALWRPDPDVLDLAPLGVLPNLAHLLLQTGTFEDLHHITGLTRLACNHAMVSGVQRLAPTLQHLQVENGILLNTDRQVLSACTGLTQLVLIGSLIVDNSDVMYVVAAMTLVPANIELLTQLHTLHVSAGNASSAATNLAWVSLLTSLEDLSIQRYHAPHDKLRSVSLLTKLTRLVISGNPEVPDDESDLGMKWHRLQAL